MSPFVLPVTVGRFPFVRPITNGKDWETRMTAWLTTGDPIAPLDLQHLLEQGDLFKQAGGTPAGTMQTIVAQSVALFMYRQDFIRDFGFVIPTQDVIQVLGAFAPLVEIGAGTGYLAKLLAWQGADIVAYDRPHAQSNKNYHFTIGKWFKVGSLSATQALKLHPDRTALFCWPEMDGWAGKALARHLPRTVAYIGEFGGCTGDDLFHHTLETKYRSINRLSLCNFPGIRDNLTLWELC